MAEFFGKEHRNVLADIDRLIEEGVLDFQQVPYRHPQNGQLYRAFDMTRDGFTLLAMGFTGSSALRFKLAYIAAFNDMEAKLKASVPALPSFTDPAEAAIAWATEYKAKQLALAQVEEMKPLAVVGARALAHDRALNRFMRTLPGVNTMKAKTEKAIPKTPHENG